MKSKVLNVFVLFALVFTLFGCVSSKSANVYSRDAAMKIQTIEKGVVESVKPVLIEGTKTPVGTTVGAVSGGVLGTTIGSGSGKTLATLVGALAGAAVGMVAEENITQKEGLEIVVKKESGESIIVVQEADVMLSPGDSVSIIYANDGTARVSKS